MKNTNWMKEMSWTEFAERKLSCDTVIIPGGAIEVYGPQLPLGSDSIVSKAICEMVAEKTNAMIGPFIEVGESAALYGFPGTIKIMPQTYYLMMRDVMESLIHWGFKNFMFINMHAGNVPIIGQLCREYQRSSGIKCAQIDWWRFTQPNSVGICEIRDGWPTDMPVNAELQLCFTCILNTWILRRQSVSECRRSIQNTRILLHTRNSGTKRRTASSGMQRLEAGKKVRLLSGNAWIRLPPL